MTRRVQDIVIVGRDAPVWLTALAVQRFVGIAGARVSVVELPPNDEAVDAVSTLPTHHALHEMVGLKEEALLRNIDSSYAFGQRYANWSKGGDPFMHAYDGHGVSLYSVPFHHYWLKARRNGMTVPIEDFSLGAVAAKQSRYVENDETTREFSHVSYGFNIDAPSYAEYLRKIAIKVGVRTIASEIADVMVSDGRITGVTMPSGHKADGDFFIDVSGREAVLMSALGEDAREMVSWREWLPADRTLALSGPRLSPLPGHAQISAFRGGWIGLYPLQGRTAAVAAYNSEAMTDDEVALQLPTLSGIALSGDALAAPFEAGIRRRPWHSNCAAIGGAAATLEPLDSVPMGLVQAGISCLTSLFPVDADAMPEAKTFNRLFTEQAERMRDFQIAHYALNKRQGEPYWDAARSANLPEALQYKIDVFTARGIMPIFDGEAFGQENWISSFLGHGLIPSDYDPRVDFVPDDDQIDAFQSILQTIAQQVRSGPSIESQVDLYGMQKSPFMG